MLAVLLLHANEPVSTDRLVDELWGSRPPATATKLVATYVWQLRKALGESTIITRPPGYAAVVSPDQLDRARFDELVARGQAEKSADAAKTLREALDLWRGPALADVTFESSAHGDVARLDDERLGALAQRIDHDLALGSHEAVLGELQALVHAHPFRERFQAQLMLALYRSGRQAEALKSYREARRRFVDELGIEPGPELQQLERSILAQDPTLVPPSGTLAASQPPASSTATTLPQPVSAFVGREDELADLLSEIEGGARLVTLTGPGGSGKTRLAIEAARTAATDFQAGTFWVGLASLRDPSLVLGAIAETVGAKGDVAQHIGDRRILLLVDNLEHVIDAAPELATILGACPNLTMLVTSRERMRVEGEVDYPVPPLSTGDAVALFCRRANVAPTPEVETLCARLDNLPLAVELAAGRAKALSPAQLLERLSERLDVFTGGRDADPRQATLRATIEWSHDLLSARERQLFAMLAAFPGGCTLDAAIEVCDADLDTLEALVEKSLLRTSSERYWMLATIREFAAERFAESGELDAVMDRLAIYLADLAEAEGAPSFLGRVAEAYERLDLEHANVRAVVEWAVAKRRYERVAELVLRYRDVWTSRSNMLEVARWADQAVRARDTMAAELWPRVLMAVEQVRLFAGDRPGAQAAAEEGLEALAHIPPDPYLEAMLLSELSALSFGDGDFEEARRLAERSLEIRTSNGFPTGRAIQDLGQIALVEGDLDEAQRLFEDALASLQARGAAHNVAVATRFLAEVARRRGHLAEATALARDALARFGGLGDVDATASCLRDLAVLSKQQGQLEEASRLWVSANAMSQFENVTVFEREIGDLPEVEAPPDVMTIEDALALVAASPH